MDEAGLVKIAGIYHRRGGGRKERQGRPDRAVWMRDEEDRIAMATECSCQCRGRESNPNGPYSLPFQHLINPISHIRATVRLTV